MQYYLTEYNIVSRTPMSLVMFKFTLEHISKVSRVLLQDAGHCMLVGIGGGGRQSVTKMATAIAEYLLFQVKKGFKRVCLIFDLPIFTSSDRNKSSLHCGRMERRH